ncbi:olfactory receptor 10J4-like [Erinaceus europaeus]|uniref:Olfactory receptor 10J4-like n=1 Tax=Erinaceus europaeus TaxID=9365 RepID=A0A1S3A7J8_ERIEU|nr:olfactory receptor 10J4-like [Erinaceus europaeus]
MNFLVEDRRVTPYFTLRRISVDVDSFSSFLHQLTLFAVFLTLYLLTLVGKVIIVTIFTLDHHLHKPMYLSAYCQLQRTYWHHPYANYVHQLQLHSNYFPKSPNCVTTTLHGQDDLHRVLASGSWSIRLNIAILQVMQSLPFCKANITSHFFCDIWPLMEPACANTTIKEFITLFISLYILALPIILISIFSVLIIITILIIASVKGIKKSFCHLPFPLPTIVIIHYSYTSFIYLKSKSKSQNSLLHRLISVTYTAMSLLKPVMFSLRDKVKEAVLRALGRKFLS